MAENFSRLNRIVKKDPYVTPSSPFEKFVANGGSGGGMPDASGLKDGTVMVAVGGKFVPVEGYGYSVAGNSYGPFYWDGVYHEDDPDAFYQGHSGYYQIFKKIADDDQNIGIESSIHVVEDGDEYILSYVDAGLTGILLFAENAAGHMLVAVKDPSKWDEPEIESHGTGVFVCSSSTTEPQDGDPVAKPAEYTIINGPAVGTFDKKYIPSVIDIKIVSELPSTGEPGIIYMVPDYSDSGDSYSEYVWVVSNQTYELLGHRKLDLSDYVTNTQLDEEGFVTNTQLDEKGFVTNTQLNNKGFVTNTQLNNKDYVTNTQLNNKDYVTNTQLNNKGFVTSTQVDDKLNAKIVTGTTEYEDGVTDLANGVVYLQYEV